MPKFEKGNFVPAYRKPLTKEGYEGQAQLIECVNELEGVCGGFAVQTWRVRFKTPVWGEICTRSFLTDISHAPQGAELTLA